MKATNAFFLRHLKKTG